MPKIALILACCLVGSIFSFDAQALPVSPVRTQVAAFDVTLVRGSCGLGLHRGPRGDCVPNGEPYDHVFGVPYVAPPTVGLPYVGSTVGLPYVAPPTVGLPYVGPTVGLPYVAPPTVGLPYVGPTVGLPYVAPPTVGLPYVGPRAYVVPRRVCAYGYSYYPPSGSCVRL
jgi:hypothetical protein